MIMRAGRPRYADEHQDLATVAADLAAHSVRWSSPDTAQANIAIAAAIAADWRRVADRGAVRPASTVTNAQKAATLAEAATRARELARRQPMSEQRAIYAEIVETLHWWADKAATGRGCIQAITDFNVARANERAAAQHREAA